MNKMKILTVNAGSSSLKFNCIELPSEKELISGYFERIGMDASFYSIKINGAKTKKEAELKNHTDAVNFLKDELINNGIVSSLDEIDGVGHRLVHGGDKFKDSVLLTEEVIKECEKFNELAPLHNPAMIMCIRAFESAMKDTPMVGVFDTSFHQSIPEINYLYSVPYSWYKDYGVRKYGFHGTSHKYVATRVAELEEKADLKVINCHLGQGASICAIKDGKSIDTSMGLTPLAGIPMATRCGDIDPAIIPYIMKRDNLGPEDIEEILNKQAGAWGVSGVSSDYKDIEDGYMMGDQRSILTLDSQAYKVAQYIGQYMISLGGLDILTFAGGVGENGIETRERICKYLEPFGVKLDLEANKIRGKEKCISTEDSKIKVYVIPTNEELMIAKDTFDLIK